MTIEIPSEFTAFVQGAVESGGFQSETDVVAAGLRLLQEQRSDKIESLRKAIQVGIDQLDRGEGIPAAEVFERLEQKAAAIVARRQ